MKHHQALKAQRIRRSRSMLRLYEKGMTLSEIGASQQPPITKQRVGWLIGELKKEG